MNVQHLASYLHTKGLRCLKIYFQSTSVPLFCIQFQGTLIPLGERWSDERLDIRNIFCQPEFDTSYDSSFKHYYFSIFELSLDYINMFKHIQSSFEAHPEEMDDASFLSSLGKKYK